MNVKKTTDRLPIAAANNHNIIKVASVKIIEKDLAATKFSPAIFKYPEVIIRYSSVIGSCGDTDVKYFNDPGKL
ncbi:hypothetical protein ACFL04_00795 [Patescibacteria group bacterium]